MFRNRYLPIHLVLFRTWQHKQTKSWVHCNTVVGPPPIQKRKFQLPESREPTVQSGVTRSGTSGHESEDPKLPPASGLNGPCPLPPEPQPKAQTEQP